VCEQETWQRRKLSSLDSQQLGDKHLLGIFRYAGENRAAMPPSPGKMLNQPKS
jgi:hypothetical protein